MRDLGDLALEGLEVDVLHHRDRLGAVLEAGRPRMVQTTSVRSALRVIHSGAFLPTWRLCC